MKPVPGPVEGWTFERSSAGLMIAITESGDWSTCVGIDGGTLTVFTGRPEVRIPIAVVRALLADEALTVGPLTVGEALRSMPVLEWADEVDWHQYDPVEHACRFRHRNARGWSPWRKSAAPRDATVRLVPLADADAPPEGRGSM